MRGRPPKPTALKKLEGNPGRRPLNEQEPPAPTGCPDKPAILDGVASDEWDRVTNLLEKMGLLSTADLAVITAYCLAWGEYCDAQQILNGAGGLTVEVGENNVEQPHPMLSIRRRAAKEMLAAAQLLGLSPVARTRLHTGPKKEKTNALIEFLQSRKTNGKAPPQQAEKPARPSKTRGVGSHGEKRGGRKGSA